jgi:hypothetical protein
VNDQAIIKFFEELEPPEGIWAELLRRTVVMTRSPDVVHNTNAMKVMDRISSGRWSPLRTQYVDMLDDVSVPMPDVVVLRRGAGPTQGTLMPSEVVTALVEVVSPASADRDYGVKRSIYAAAKVPAYLITDAVMAQCVLLAEPQGEGEYADYRWQRTARFGEAMPVEPLGIELDTSAFGTYENVRPHRHL